ncbi:MarR family winged helix-turn-helix transcriptional regulator [Streptosporangium sp. NBC_01755]|uniref:MarR family winged helix-turn-helix transcriptional regulator n=1 Tax=unclassified Streptosporangium TaxID=2632669 RepID=UPI002DDAAD55|nr:MULTISPECIES: MarR family winged helix-turn-helix transcriptional regulator [unclassified Streptosporangium]WSA27038.1 MarR family winged helix-turn-helix transcriptional regulator [Streptosporangium sp. NBC_01810]WSD01550.1 MarR family winged helix-turn-helix transcriptional regulator [Streptosporangium sp. NBC_01755]
MNEGTPGAVIDVALFRLRRIWSRPLRARKAEESQRPVPMSNVMVVHAVHKLSLDVSEVTVGAVAEQLDVDPSTASRLVNDAIGAGFVEREESVVDARRARLVLSERGRRVLEAVVRHRRTYLDSLMADWDEQDREAFARFLARFAEAAIARPANPANLDRVIAETLAETSAPG